MGGAPWGGCALQRNVGGQFLWLLPGFLTLRCFTFQLLPRASPDPFFVFLPRQSDPFSYFISGDAESHILDDPSSSP